MRKTVSKVKRKRGKLSPQLTECKCYEKIGTVTLYAKGGIPIRKAWVISKKGSDEVLVYYPCDRVMGIFFQTITDLFPIQHECEKRIYWSADNDCQFSLVE